jgi:predicted ATPase
LRKEKTLLVVDNCEHLLEGVAYLVDALLASCPKVRIIATSRERLNTSGEVNRVVPSLTVPDSHQQAYTPRELEAYESVRLFVERARQRDLSFVLSTSNAQAISEICQRLEGIPLAIELAAARIGMLSAGQLAKRLEDSLKVLSAGERTAEPRHQSLRATLEWSHDLLSDKERVLYRRLCVFAGGWTLEAAEEVCSGEGLEQSEVLDVLSGVADKSLVVAEASPAGGDQLRYRMLEPVRQYASEKLGEDQEAQEARRRHAHHYLALAETAEPELWGAEQAEWLWRLRTELGNLQGALWWSLEPGQERARAELRLRLVAALWRFWDVQGFGEGKRWLQTALEKDPGIGGSNRAH